MAHSVAHSLHEQMMIQEKRKRGGERKEGERKEGEGRREEGGREGGKEGPTQYIWVVFEPPCNLLPEHVEMVLYLLFIVIETLPVCVCVCVYVCVWGGGGGGGEWEEVAHTSDWKWTTRYS